MARHLAVRPAKEKGARSAIPVGRDARAGNRRQTGYEVPVMTLQAPALYHVYNADGGLLNAVKDSFHKTFAPASYPCALCALAFGFFAMRGEWKRLRRDILVPQYELHRDDYVAVLPDLDERLPVIVLREADGKLRPIVRAAEMEAMERLEELVALTRSRLAEAGVPLVRY
jgi:hypothetical protein